MSERSLNFLWTLASVATLAGLFMVVQCKEKQDAEYAQAALVCTSGGGQWVDGMGQCLRPTR